jgi:phosphatidylinositol glycan class B
MSLLVVASAYRMGLATSRIHALVAGVVAATWFELVYFSFRPLTEAISTDFLIAALSLASLSAANPTFKRLVLAGL